MTAHVHVPIEADEVQCDAACYNTNIFAPGGYKVRCEACRGRRGRYKDDRWIDCRSCGAQAAFVALGVSEAGRSG
jgi:hypothetical protein